MQALPVCVAVAFHKPNPMERNRTGRGLQEI
jgi:hypothetical protein